MKKQVGVSLTGLLLGCVVLAVLALAAMKVGPVYLEYAQIKKSVAGMLQSNEARSGSVADLRKAFDRFAQVNDITSITGQDLDISKDGTDIVIAFAYPKKVHLFANVSLEIEFTGSSK